MSVLIAFAVLFSIAFIVVATYIVTVSEIERRAHNRNMAAIDATVFQPFNYCTHNSDRAPSVSFAYAPSRQYV